MELDMDGLFGTTATLFNALVPLMGLVVGLSLGVSIAGMIVKSIKGAVGGDYDYTPPKRTITATPELPPAPTPPPPVRPKPVVVKPVCSYCAHPLETKADREHHKFLGCGAQAD